MKLDILAFGAHPDDVEMCAAGTLIKEVRNGKKVGIVDLTRGELGTRGTPELRAEEAKKSGEIIGIHHRTSLNMGDGFFEITEKNLIQVIQEIRAHKPNIVLANVPEDRHPDHGRGSELVKRACFLAGLVKIESEYEGKKQAPHRPKALYYYVQDKYKKPDIVIDVSDVIDLKIEAMLAYSSQFYKEGQKGPQTPISSKAFLDYFKMRSGDYGRQIGVEFGEGFIADRYVGANDLSSLV